MSYSINRRARTLFFLLIVVLVVVGCNQRTGVSWADISVATDAQDIMVSYQNEIVLVSRTNGFVVTSDLQGTSNIRDAANVWRLQARDLGSEFYTTPLFVDYGDERLMLIADYNSRILIANFTANCLSNRAGACVGEDPSAYVELPGRVLANMGHDDQRIYIPMSENDVIALNKGLYEPGWDISDATERRQRFDNTLSVAWTFPTERGVWAQPVVLNGEVYISSMDHKIYRVDAATGEEIARLDLGGALASSVVVYDGTPATDFNDVAGQPEDAEIDMDNAVLFTGTFGRKLYRIPVNFASDTEDTLESFQTNGWIWGAPKIADGILYTADLNGYVYAIDISEGQFNELWRTQTEIGGIRASPLVTEDHVVVASREGKVQWLRREDGSRFTEQDVRNEVLAELLLIPGDGNRESLIIVSTVNNSRIMVAFTLDGAQRWTYPS